MATTVVGGREDSGDIRPHVREHSVVVVRKPHPLLLALVSTHYAQQLVGLQEGFDGAVAIEIGAATRRVGHEVKLQELKTNV